MKKIFKIKPLTGNKVSYSNKKNIKKFKFNLKNKKIFIKKNNFFIKFKIPVKYINNFYK